MDILFECTIENHVPQVCTFLLTLLLFLLNPSLFPALQSMRAWSTFATYLKWLLPVAVFFSLNLVLSNEAYLYASMAFLQILKEVNP